MKKFTTLFLLMIAVAFQAQTTANRFFYELTFKPKKDSAKLDKVMSVLDITKEKSLFRDYTSLEQDSVMKEKVMQMQKTGVFTDIWKEAKMPKFSYKITKKYPDMQITYSESMLNGMQPIQLAYNDNPKFSWKVQPEKAKIGEYNTQKATTEFGGRKWTAWFSKDLPFQDGPYKFYGLPGLIVKIEDEGKNYSWELRGNKKVADFQEQTEMEKMRPGGAGSVVNVSREKFEKTFDDYKKDPMSSFRSQMPAEVMSRKLPGQDRTIGDMMKDIEKKVKSLYNSNDNPIEILPATKKK